VPKVTTITLADIIKRKSEVFTLAETEPVLLSTDQPASHVVMWSELFRRLASRLEELEDRFWAELAIEAESMNYFVEANVFRSALQGMIDADR